MQSTSVEYLERWNRWTVVTVEFLREKGFTHFAWINPSEVLGDSYINPYGGTTNPPTLQPNTLSTLFLHSRI